MARKLLLGYNVGSSAVKASLLDADTGESIAFGFSPQQEMRIDSRQAGWAEQHPDSWWDHVVKATNKLYPETLTSNSEIIGIGISYQMHGLVMVGRISMFFTRPLFGVTAELSR